MGSSHRPLDLGSGLVIDTRDLGRRAGGLKELRTTASAPADLGTSVIAVPPGSPVELELRLESVVEGVLVTGSAHVLTTGECGRCLEPISVPIDVDLLELFVYPGQPGDDEEVSRLDGEMLDLEPVLRDQIVLELPFQPVCREDCPGLCVDCGARLADDPDHGHGDDVDPRWGDLAGWDIEAPAAASPTDRAHDDEDDHDQHDPARPAPPADDTLSR